MAFRITKEYVWVGAIPDRSDALAEKLRAFSEGGLNLELIISRREPPERAVLFISPLRTLEEIEAAQNAGLARADSFLALRIEGPNTAGLGARIATAVARAGISLRDYAAAALGDRSVTCLAFDSKADVDEAKAILERELSI